MGGSLTTLLPNIDLILHVCFRVGNSLLAISLFVLLLLLLFKKEWQERSDLASLYKKSDKSKSLSFALYKKSDKSESLLLLFKKRATWANPPF